MVDERDSESLGDQPRLVQGMQQLRFGKPVWAIA